MPIFRPPPGTYVGGQQPWAAPNDRIVAPAATVQASWSAAGSAGATFAGTFLQAGIKRRDADLYANYWRQTGVIPPPGTLVEGQQPWAARWYYVNVIHRADWSCAGAATASFVGSANAPATVEADGVATASWTGLENALASWSAAGQAAATWAGQGTAPAAWSASAAAATTWTGTPNAQGNLGAAGIASAGWDSTGTTYSTYQPWSPAQFYAQIWEQITKRTIPGAAAYVSPVVTVTADWGAAGSATAAWVGQGGSYLLGPTRYDAPFYANLWHHLELVVPIQEPAALPLPQPSSSYFSAAGVAAASWVGQESVSSAWTATGVATAAWSGNPIDQGAWSAAAIGGVGWVGAPFGQGNWSTAGIATASWTAQSTWLSSIQASGTATAQWIGLATGAISTNFGAAGVATADWTGAETDTADWSADGVASVTWVGGIAKPSAPYDGWRLHEKRRREQEEQFIRVFLDTIAARS